MERSKKCATDFYVENVENHPGWSCHNDTREICTELDQLAVSHVTWIGQFSPRHHQELDWKQKKADASLPASLCWTYPLLNDFIICLDTWHDHPGKWLLTLLNVLSLYCRNCLLWLWLVIQDTVLGQCTFPLCQWSKQLINCHWRNYTLIFIQIWHIFMRRNIFHDFSNFIGLVYEWKICQVSFIDLQPFTLIWLQMTPGWPQLTLKVPVKNLNGVYRLSLKFMWILITNMRPQVTFGGPQLTRQYLEKNPIWMVTTQTKFQVHTTLHTDMTSDNPMITSDDPKI